MHTEWGASKTWRCSSHDPNSYTAGFDLTVYVGIGYLHDSDHFRVVLYCWFLIRCFDLWIRSLRDYRCDYQFLRKAPNALQV